MMQKLEIMRKKKQEYLEYQRQLALHRMAESEREIFNKASGMPGAPGPMYPMGYPPYPGAPGPMPGHMFPPQTEGAAPQVHSKPWVCLFEARSTTLHTQSYMPLPHGSWIGQITILL